MAETTTRPEFGTEAYQWWAAGAADNEAAHREGVTDENREVVQMFDAMRDAAYGPQTMVEMMAVVYGPGLPWRKRRHIAWRVLRGYRRRRWSVEVSVPRTELSVGVRWDERDTGLHVWVSVFALVLHFRRLP